MRVVDTVDMRELPRAFTIAAVGNAATTVYAHCRSASRETMSVKAPRVWLLLLACMLTISFGKVPSAHTQPLSVRQRIAFCYATGAVNVQLMQHCAGLFVPPPEFHSCMRGGPCFGEGPIVMIPVGGPRAHHSVGHRRIRPARSRSHAAIRIRSHAT